MRLRVIEGESTESERRLELKRDQRNENRVRDLRV